MRTTKDINGNLITFKNYYQNTDVEIPVTKHMEGRQITENDVFQFVLLDENGNRVDTLMLHGKKENFPLKASSDLSITRKSELTDTPLKRLLEQILP